MDISDYVEYAKIEDADTVTRDRALSVERSYTVNISVPGVYTLNSGVFLITMDDMESDDFFVEKEKEGASDFDLILDDIREEEELEHFCLWDDGS